MIDLASFPWHRYQDNAAFVAQSVVRLISGSDSYQNPRLAKLASVAGGFSFYNCKGPIVSLEISNDKLLVSSILKKIAQRGSPSPCSLDVERAVLEKAREEGALDYKEAHVSGAIRFDVKPMIKNLPSMLEACFFRELLLDDQSASEILERYRSLCSGPELEFFNSFVNKFGDRRLGLFILPQRKMSSMYVEGFDSQRVDFAIELPKIEGEGWLRIVIEIDDSSHRDAQLCLDKKRDTSLRGVGWDVRRLDATDRTGWDLLIDEVVDLILDCIPGRILGAARALRSLEAGRRRAIQDLVLLPLAEAQIATAIAYQLGTHEGECLRIGGKGEIDIGPVVRSINAMLEHISTIHDADNVSLVVSDEEPDIFFHSLLSADCFQPPWEGGLIVCPCLSSAECVRPIIAVEPRPIRDNKSKDIEIALEYFLQNIFRKERFKPGQLEVIVRAMHLKPTIGLLPTAGGKSLAYQLPAILQPGIAFVVDPLRSLMVDQTDNLANIGIHRTIRIMSGMGLQGDEFDLRDRSSDLIRMGGAIFVFIAPERFQTPSFNETLHSIRSMPIPYFVIDEAHCVSEWGHDFRPAYLSVGRRFDALSRGMNKHIGIIALTGTASRNVLVDIVRELNIVDDDAVVEPSSLDRSELTFKVVKCTTSERHKVIEEQILSLANHHGWKMEDKWVPSGLIFTNFAISRDLGVLAIQRAALNSIPANIGVFSGRSPYLEVDEAEWDRKKLNIQEYFKKDIYPILVCTHSFGMGIDKPTIRFTLNTMLPRSLEEFYQEAGRAGRDGNSSTCVLLFSDDRPELSDELLDTEKTPFESLAGKMTGPARDQPDAIRNTWFLTNSYMGADNEKDLLLKMTDWIFALSKDDPGRYSHPLELSFSETFFRLPIFKKRTIDDGSREQWDEERMTLSIEKTLFRLQTIGFIREYLKDYKGNKFIIYPASLSPGQISENLRTYLRKYISEGEVQTLVSDEQSIDLISAVNRNGSALIDFIYDKIVKKRRRATGQMLQVARQGIDNPSAFRDSLLAYMEESEFSELVIDVSMADEPEQWFDVLSKADGIEGMKRLLGACRRQLEENPSHPGLLTLSGISKLALNDKKNGLQDLENGFLSLRKQVSDRSKRAYAVEQTLKSISRVSPTEREAYIIALLNNDDTHEIVDLCYREADEGSESHQLSISIVVNAVADAIRSGEAHNE